MSAPAPVYLSCREVGTDKPCRFAKHCHANRQHVHSSYNPPIWGQDCGYFLMFSDGVAVVDERVAIQDEGQPA